jgi:hypothetical protein
MQFVVSTETFHRGDFAPVRLNGEDHAGLYGGSVPQDGARAAAAYDTSDMSAGQPELVS